MRECQYGHLNKQLETSPHAPQLTLMAILLGCKWVLVSFIIRWPSTAAHESLVALLPLTSSLRRSSNCWWRCWDCDVTTCNKLVNMFCCLLFHCLFSFACSASCGLPVARLYHLDHVIRCYGTESWTVHRGRVLVTSLGSWNWSLSSQSTTSLLQWYPVVTIDGMKNWHAFKLGSDE